MLELYISKSGSKEIFKTLSHSGCRSQFMLYNVKAFFTSRLIFFENKVLQRQDQHTQPPIKAEKISRK